MPWDQLSEEIKELDRQTVRGLPGFLAPDAYQAWSDRLLERGLVFLLPSTVDDVELILGTMD